MNLIAHIVRKDLRRLATPLGAWLALVIGKAAALVIYARGSAPWPDEWLGPAAACVNGLEIILGYLIAVLLVLEDSPTDGRALWKTRPISGATLLIAKLCAAALAFVAVPVLLLIPVWLVAGFGPGELGLATLDWVCARGALTLVALTMAAVSGGLATAIFAPLALALPIGLGAFASWTPLGDLVGVLIFAVVAGGLTLALQYAKHRRAAATFVWILGAGYAATGIVSAFKAPPPVKVEDWAAAKDGLPVAVGSAQETSAGHVRIFSVTAGTVTRLRENGIIREARTPTHVRLREARLGSTLFSKAIEPEPVFRWQAASDEAGKSQARRRGQALAASIQVIAFSADLPPGAEARASWHGWRTRTEDGVKK